jgi:hypothetical protein
VTSTTGTRTLPDEQPKRRGPGAKGSQDVKDVLKEIFKDKKKLGGRKGGAGIQVGIQSPAATGTGR